MPRDASIDESKSPLDAKLDELVSPPEDTEGSIDGLSVFSTDEPCSPRSSTRILVEPVVDYAYVQWIELDAVRSEMSAMKVSLCNFMNHMMWNQDILRHRCSILRNSSASRWIVLQGHG